MCKICYPLLDELIRTRGIRKSVMAARLNISEKTLYNKLAGVTPAPDLPAEVVEKTREKYLECLQLLVPQK